MHKKFKRTSFFLSLSKIFLFHIKPPHLLYGSKKKILYTVVQKTEWTKNFQFFNFGASSTFLVSVDMRASTYINTEELSV